MTSTYVFCRFAAGAPGLGVEMNGLDTACRAWMGIDPGQSGAIVVIGEDRHDVEWILNKDTDHDIDDFVRQWDSQVELAMIEKVASSPQMGVRSAFTFGRSAGFLAGVLTARRIPIDYVTPAAWQKELKCRSGGDKNVTKAAAQKLYPQLKVTHAIADALLLAEFCKRRWIARHPRIQGNLN